MTLRALITGGNRGIGRATALQLAQQGIHTIIGGRDHNACRKVADEIIAAGDQASWQALDLTSPETIDTCIEQCGDIDILINNAGIFPDSGTSVFDTNLEAVRTAMQVHLHGPLQLTRALLAGMQARGYGRVVNLTSGYASLNGMQGELTAYRTSKAALNALTCILAAEVSGDVKINAVDPGWVRTDMGGGKATRSAAEAGADVVLAATFGRDGPNGKLLRYGEVVEW